MMMMNHPKVNVIARMEFKLVHDDVAVQDVSHNSKETPTENYYDLLETILVCKQMIIIKKQ